MPRIALAVAAGAKYSCGRPSGPGVGSGRRDDGFEFPRSITKRKFCDPQHSRGAGAVLNLGGELQMIGGAHVVQHLREMDWRSDKKRDRCRTAGNGA